MEGLRIVQNVNRDDTSVAYQSFIATYRERFNRGLVRQHPVL